MTFVYLWSMSKKWTLRKFVMRFLAFVWETRNWQFRWVICAKFLKSFLLLTHFVKANHFFQNTSHFQLMHFLTIWNFAQLNYYMNIFQTSGDEKWKTILFYYHCLDIFDKNKSVSKIQMITCISKGQGVMSRKFRPRRKWKSYSFFIFPFVSFMCSLNYAKLCRHIK